MRGPGVRANIDVSCQTKHQVTALGNSPQQPWPATALPVFVFPYRYHNSFAVKHELPMFDDPAESIVARGRLLRDQARTSGHRRTQADEMGSGAIVGSTL